MQVWNVLHEARWKCRPKNSPKNRHLGTIVQLCQAIPSQLRHISVIRQKLVGSRPSDHYFRSVCWFACLFVCAVFRAVARISFLPRQRWTGDRGSGAEPTAVSRGTTPGQGIRRRSPLELRAESFSVVGYQKEMENLLQFSYFTTYSLFSKMP